MKHIEMKSYGGKFQIKDLNTKERIVTGYGGIFGNVDRTGDVLMKGAAMKSIMENGPQGKDRIKYLAQHKMDEEPIGKMLSIQEDEKGIIFQVKMADTTKGRDYMSLIKGGIVNENSIGYKSIQYDANAYGGRDLKEISLWEISAVNVAMNEEAVILDAKGMFKPDAVKSTLERYENLANLLRKGSISDDMGFQLEAELYKLKSLFETATTQPLVESTEPETKSNEAIQAELYSEIVKHLNQ